MKTKKLSLNDLKVESFVTSMESQKVNTVKGGTTPECVVVVTAITVTLSVASVASIITIATDDGLKDIHNSVCCSNFKQCGPIQSADMGCRG